MKKILLLIPSMAGVGGTERMVDGLSMLLAAPSCEIHQASFDAPGIPRHFDSATPFHTLGPVPRLPLPLRPLAYALSALRLRRLKRRIGIDVTISNLWGADLISALSCGNDSKIALCHINVIGNPSNRLMVKLRPLVAAVYHRFQRVVAVSESLAEELKALYRLPSSRITHIDNFVDKPEAVSKLPKDSVRRFVWCGRFSPEKNVDGLLHAWVAFAEQRPGVQLVLLGEGPLQADMRALAGALGLRAGIDPGDIGAQVVFAGKVSDPASFMLGARALLLSSHAEGLPMVLLEALSLGLPVLAADCQAGGVRRALQGHGTCCPERADAEFTVAGALLPVPLPEVPATLAEWGQVLRRTCEDEQQWRDWQQGALDRASHFSSAAAREKWLNLIEFTGPHA